MFFFRIADEPLPVARLIGTAGVDGACRVNLFL